MNTIITNKKHLFVNEEIEDIKGSLRFYCTYILVETTGKHGIAPLQNRLDKLDKIVEAFIQCV